MVRRDPSDDEPSAWERGRHGRSPDEGAEIIPLDSRRVRDDSFPVFRHGKSGPVEVPPEEPFQGWRRGSTRQERENPAYDSWVDDPDEQIYRPAAREHSAREHSGREDPVPDRPGYRTSARSYSGPGDDGWDDDGWDAAEQDVPDLDDDEFGDVDHDGGRAAEDDADERRAVGHRSDEDRAGRGLADREGRSGRRRPDVWDDDPDLDSDADTAGAGRQAGLARRQDGPGTFPAWRQGTRRSRRELAAREPDAPPPPGERADRRRVPEPERKQRARFRPRSLRGAVGLGIAAAILLLYGFLYVDPQGRWWLPLAAGFVVLVLLALLRLDRLTKGWTWHIAGLAVLAGLVLETRDNPWSWAFAVSIGVLLAGLLRLPRWPVAVAGVVLCIVSFVGYQFRASEVRQQEAEIAQQAGTQMREGFGYDRPDLVLSKLNDGLSPLDTQAICRLLDAPAQAQLTAATGTADCTAAVAAASAKVPAGSSTATPRATGSNGPPPPSGTILEVNGCATAWGRAVPTVGVIETVRTDEPSKVIWRVAGFKPCTTP
ncbi:hypothetical protein [Pseudonocardia ailaonensis]